MNTQGSGAEDPLVVTKHITKYWFRKRTVKAKGYERVYLGSGGGDPKLVLYFYEGGSRRQEGFLDFLKTYKGTVQSDAYAPTKLETDQYHNITRIACLQHVKRKFLEQDKEPDARR